MLRLLTAMVAALALTGCSGGMSSSTGTPSDDTTGPTVATSTVVTIESADLPQIIPLAPNLDPAAPQRIVSLATGVGETLVALGVADRIVGRDETSDDPLLADIPVVTEAHSVSAERVLALDPDLVIVDARTTPIEALDQIAQVGVPVVEVPEAWTLGDIEPRTAAVAAAVGVDPTPLFEGLPSDATAPATGPRVAFLYLRGTAGVYLLGGSGSGADSIIAAAGGIDAGAEAGFDAFVPLTAEALATINPDVLVAMTKGVESVNGVDGLLALPGVAQTTAGREGRVIIVDDTILLSFGPRTSALVDAFRQALDQVAP